MAGLKSGIVKTCVQAGVVPFRRGRGGLEFCLITSTEGRWIFPKGAIDPGKSYKETATTEAFEEAGLRGRLLDRPLGCWEMIKNGNPYTLVLLMMKVTACEDVWEEAHFRRRRWVTAVEARRLLCQPQLRNCLDVAVGRLVASKKCGRHKKNTQDVRPLPQQARSPKASRTAKRA